MFTYHDIPGTAEFKPLNCALILEAAQVQLYEALIPHLVDNLHLPEKTPEILFARTTLKIEHDHKDLLSTTLATRAAQLPTFDFRLSSLDRLQTMALVQSLEELTARAYLGILSKLPSPKHAVLLAAIQGTESRHVSSIAYLRNAAAHRNDPPPTNQSPLDSDSALTTLGHYAAMT